MGGNVVDMRKAVQERVEKENEKKTGGGSDDGGIPSRFVRDCLKANELGDGLLFKHLHAGKFVFNKSMDCWLAWTGHHWQVDKMDRALGAVEEVVKVYLDEVARVVADIKECSGDEEKRYQVTHLEKIKSNLLKRVSRLRAARGRKNCLLFAHTSPEDPMAIEGDEIDTKPWLLACTNGVLNLRTGELADGRPEDYLLKACPVAWDGIDAPRKNWERVVGEILNGREELVDFLQRLFGLGLVGEVLQSLIVVLTGQGRNGKSSMVETATEILGPLASPIRSEMLLDQFRVPSSAGPTPDIMALRGLRMAFASETDDGCRISPSRVKWLTGNDRLTGRNPHDKYEVSFKPTHTLFLLTNHTPKAPDNDFAFWERVVLVPFELSFVNRKPKADNERRADPELQATLKKELPGILAWMVEGCLRWQKDGLQKPDMVKKATKDYRDEQDIIGYFIDDCLVSDPDERLGATEVFSVFESWWKKNVSKNPPKQIRFGKMFAQRFERKKDGINYYMGVKFSPEGCRFEGD